MIKVQNKHGGSQPKAKASCLLKPTAHYDYLIILRKSDFIIEYWEQPFKPSISGNDAKSLSILVSILIMFEGASPRWAPKLRRQVFRPFEIHYIVLFHT